MIKPTISLQELQAKIGHRAKSAPAHRFWGMYVHLVKHDTLETAYLEAKRKGGAPGSDGETFASIEAAGRGEFLKQLASELRSGTYRPRAYRRREIPKEGGKVRVISIPAVRDRVVQGALRLILEPIFEADFSGSSYGARPGRSAHQAELRDALLLGRRRRLVGGVVHDAALRKPSVLVERIRTAQWMRRGARFRGFDVGAISIPSSSVSSVASSTSTCVAPSVGGSGSTNAPRSRRFENRQSPLPSKKRILMLVRRLPMNANSAPQRASYPTRSRIRPESRSKP
ncbi:uncharacterized protein SOCEGT47_045840 [Sorangium cellulosum]|uniref:Uncharacterized protein n=1 Tax=Sorangium cellulosum TaxID=56 RepID=A0A4P2Q4F8_SORCE|nr:uncharacterized protein SOCEGT47_045840 [Sorangium cellulosum]